MIFYFSGTGNTRWAAQQLAEATGERLLFIPHELKGECRYTLDKEERIGFCFPVHGWQPPHIVRQFVSRLKLSSPNPTLAHHYAYAVCTCGDSIGLAMDMLVKELSPLGINICSTLSLIMPESYVCLPFMYTDSPEKERAKIEKAGNELDAFLDIVTQRQVFHHLVKGAAPWLMSHVIGGYFNSQMITDKKFTVDEEKCLSCGKCKEVCPTENIDFKDKKPKWKNDSSCTCCLSCYHHCPVHAINYGKITRKRGQYYFKA
ncbi:MAG: EFR1 family ferrodoxin [Prevotella sp.]|nr:EFR1 family ferrodoxin [Prevotella sp.]